jgi:beta-glucosidase
MKEILQIQKNVVVVLHNGSPVEMPWAKEVRAIVETYLCGEGTGEAIVDILYGKANPGGKIAETFPIKLEDNPSYPNFPGTGKKVEYKEGVFVGYRYYDTKKMEVLFPFGHGLSYTSFDITNMLLDKIEMKESETLIVSVDVTNTGSMTGKEVVQVYIKDATGVQVRPEKELKGFEAVTLQPGECKRVKITLDKRSFAWYNETIKDWYAATGEYRILIGTSSRNIIFDKKIQYLSETEIPFVIDKDTMIGELVNHPKTRTFVSGMLKEHLGVLTGGSGDVEENEMMAAVVKYLPLRSLRSFGTFPNEALMKIIQQLNELLN